MSNRKKIFLGIPCIIIVIIVVSIFIYAKVSGYPYVYNNSHKNRYSKVETLMSTSKYADEVEKAGYKVDHYYLKMNKRIVSLKIKNNPRITISAPANNKIDYDIIMHNGSNNKETIISLTVNKSGKLTYYDGSVFEKGKETLDYKISRIEADQYLQECNKATDKMLTKVYFTNWK
ncbi:hypothetical protein [Listeria valentina]|uniref:hypothetical protein n=1 Tax=Listeria valentina TaxID=2705293 RepID=UPI00143203A3|nr:hypothetical protein [Listeria valentina]